MPVDYAEAMRLCQAAAKNKLGAGMTCIGLLYQGGLGMPRDYESAAKWYTEGAKVGDPQAMHYLGALYSKGLGVPANKVLAYTWYLLAARWGDKGAQQDAEVLKSQLESRQIAKAAQAASDFLTKNKFPH